MFQKSGVWKNRRSPGRRKGRLSKKSRPDQAESRRTGLRTSIAAAAAVLLTLFFLGSFLLPGSPREESPPPQKAQAHSAGEADQGFSPCFYELLLCHEIPGLKSPAADSGAWIRNLFCRVLDALTGIDPADPCSVLDLELGAGRGVPLPVASSPPSRGSGNGRPAAPEPEPDRENPALQPWGGSLFPFPFSGHHEAKVLLYHTHASETFVSAGSGETVPTVVTAGEELARILEESYGLPVFHHRSVYDLPRREAYKKARPPIMKLIAENPGIELVIDLHRDGVARSKTTVFAAEQELARILLVHGRRNPGAKKNLEFVTCLESELEAVIPSLSRGIMQQDFIYNQDLHPYAVLIELGGHENSIDEAMHALPYLAEAIARAYYIFFLQG